MGLGHSSVVGVVAVVYKKPVSTQTRQVAHAYNLSKSWRQEVAQLETAADYILDLRPAWGTSRFVSKLANKQRGLRPHHRGRHQRPRPTRQDSANSTSGTQGMRGQELSSARLGQPCCVALLASVLGCPCSLPEILYILWVKYPLMT